MKNTEVENKILKEHHSLKKIQIPEFNPQAAEFVLSDGQTLTLKDTSNFKSKTIFKALNYIVYLLNYTDEIPPSRVRSIKTYTKLFINFINESKQIENLNSNLLKEFETFRVNSGVKPQSTGASELRSNFSRILLITSFTSNLSSPELDLLTITSDIKLAPYDESDSYTLTAWLSEHTWLRREDIGIGADLYARLSSPRAVMKSFDITTEVALLEIQRSKSELVIFFKKNRNLVKDFINIPRLDGNKPISTIRLPTPEKERIIRANIDLLQIAYHKDPDQPEALRNAFTLLLSCFSHEMLIKDTQSRFFENKKLTRSPKIKDKLYIRFSAKDGSLFTMGYIHELILYANNIEEKAFPISIAEHVLFNWMMASLCVQPSDISKLRLCDFNLLKKNNGSIISIESEYFKGRSNTYQVMEGVKGNTIKGQALYNFLRGVTENLNAKYIDKPLSFILNVSIGNSKSGGYPLLIKNIYNSYIYQSIIKEHLNNKVTNIIIPSLNKLSMFGLNYEGNKSKDKLKLTLEEFFMLSRSPLKPNFFSLTHIKNSPVHSKSDCFSPTRLLNYRSHNNNTERNFYLTSASEEWLNNCGLITRAVMQDIYSNVYRLSEVGAHSFNSEFMNATEAIDQRKNDVLVRMKLITGKSKGEISNELGIRKVEEESAFNDNIYIIDSGETVMKLKHYISEAEIHCKTLLESDPVFVFNTLLPTVEWIESLFLDSKFSFESVEKGEALFNQFGTLLPPLFQSNGA